MSISNNKYRMRVPTKSGSSTRFLHDCVLLLCVLLLSLSFTSLHHHHSHVCASALEATWTPAETNPEEAGPLPLSQNQRQQLLQLDQHISSASNPTEALQQVAASNNMDPNELYQLLMRNRQDMQMAGGGGGSKSAMARHTLPRKLLTLIQTVAVLILSYARVHPQRFSIVLMSLCMIFFLLYSAPRSVTTYSLFLSCIDVYIDGRTDGRTAETTYTCLVLCRHSSDI